MITFQEIFKAYKNCRTRKKYSRQKTFFEVNICREMTKLVKDLNSRKYKLSPSTFFIISHPKPREIFAAHFRDRIVHHYLVSKLEPIWERKFSNANFACRIGKGTHEAIKILQQKVHSISCGGTKHVYVLQMDIKQFFASIHRPTLLALYHKHNPYKDITWLIDLVIGHDARKNIIQFKKTDACNELQSKFLREGKSWFSKPEDTGIPIGNLTSQFGAGIYLNDFDHHVQRILKPKAYLRYMDDLTFIDTSRKKLEAMIKPVTDWLFLHRKMSINTSKTKLGLLKHGINFLGYKIKQIGKNQIPNNQKRNKNSTVVLIPKSKKWDLIKNLKKLNTNLLLTSSFLSPLSSKRIYQKANKNFATINSKLGHIKHGKNYIFRKKSIEMAILDTSIKDFDCNSQENTYWGLIKTKQFGSIKKSARIKKIMTGR